jgi:hypothetical protein
MERSMMSELATRSVSTVATDQVGVSASDRISPVASAPVPSGPAIFLSPRHARLSRERQADATYSSARTNNLLLLFMQFLFVEKLFYSLVLFHHHILVGKIEILNYS